MKLPIAVILPVLPSLTVATPSPSSKARDTNCGAASETTKFQLTFLSYGNWTALPSQVDNPIQHLESVSFAVTNVANGVSTVCAFSLDLTHSSGNDTGATTTKAGEKDIVLPISPLSPDLISTLQRTPPGVQVGEGIGGLESWKACADRKDTDGKHRFTIATGAAFEMAGRRLAVNQTWFCHDDAARL